MRRTAPALVLLLTAQPALAVEGAGLDRVREAFLASAKSCIAFIRTNTRFETGPLRLEGAAADLRVPGNAETWRHPMGWYEAELSTNTRRKDRPILTCAVTTGEALPAGAPRDEIRDAALDLARSRAKSLNFTVVKAYTRVKGLKETFRAKSERPNRNGCGFHVNVEANPKKTRFWVAEHENCRRKGPVFSGTIRRNKPSATGPSFQKVEE
ncbi:MAG: hypothetical protein AAFR17_01860 [Pseudomonadota bacterium]